MEFGRLVEAAVSINKGSRSIIRDASGYVLGLVGVAGEAGLNRFGRPGRDEVSDQEPRFAREGNVYQFPGTQGLVYRAPTAAEELQDRLPTGD